MYDPMPASAVEHFQRNFNMTKIYVKVLEPIDFLYVNDMVGNENCYICTLAALKNKTVTNLVREMKIGPIAQDDIISQIVNLYRTAGFQYAATIFNGSTVDFENYSMRNVGIGECAKFTLAFRKSLSSGCSDHYQIVYARTFRLEDGKVRYSITDFRELPFAKQRFFTSLPEDSCEFNIISPWEKTQLNDLDDKIHPFHDRSNQLFGMS